MSHFNTSIYKRKSQKLLESGALPKVILQVTRRVMYPLIQKYIYISLGSLLYVKHGGRFKDEKDADHI